MATVNQQPRDPASLEGTIQGPDLAPGVSPLLEAASNVQGAPVNPADFYSPVLEAIRGMQPPAPMEVPNVASPLGTFLSLFAANMGSQLTRNPNVATPTTSLLEDQRTQRQNAIDVNAKMGINAQQEKQKYELETLVSQAETGLKAAIASGDDAAARKAAALLKAADYMQERASTREQIKLQGEKSMGIQQEIGRQQRELVKTKSSVRQAAEDLVGASGLSKAGAQLVLRSINGYISIAESMVKPDPDTGQIAPDAENRAADFLDTRVNGAIDAQKAREGTTGTGGGGVGKEDNVLGVNVDKANLIKRARELNGRK